MNFLRHISGTYDNQAKFVANPRCALSRNYPVSGHPHKEELSGSGRMLRKIPFTGETRQRKRKGRSGLSVGRCFASWSHWTKLQIGSPHRLQPVPGSITLVERECAPHLYRYRCQLLPRIGIGGAYILQSVDRLSLLLRSYTSEPIGKSAHRECCFRRSAAP